MELNIDLQNKVNILENQVKTLKLENKSLVHRILYLEELVKKLCEKESISFNFNSLPSITPPKKSTIKLINPNIQINSINYQKNKGKNLIFTFNKKKDKSKNNKKITNNNTQDKLSTENNKINNINSNISNDTLNSNSNVYIIPFNENNQVNITKDLSEKNYPITNISNKSVSINNILINKSNDMNRKTNKFR